MRGSRVLYVSGSLGLGHVTRDLAIAAELRRRDPSLRLCWLASEPALTVLREAGEEIVPEAADYADNTMHVDGGKDFRANIVLYALRARKSWDHNGRLIGRMAEGGPFDLVVADEVYEFHIYLDRQRKAHTFPYVGMYDFVGADPTTRNPIEWLAKEYFARGWVRWDRKLRKRGSLLLFVGDPEDIPESSFGPGLPGRRAHALEHYAFTGQVLPFDLAPYTEREGVRRRLGYDGRPLIVATVGGSALGHQLLVAAAKALPYVRAKVPGTEMLVVTGPRIDPASIPETDGLTARGFVPRLYEHLAACDVAVVQGGATTTLELTALGRPFLYFPLKGHVEQERYVAGRLERWGAGIRLDFHRMTPALLADVLVGQLQNPPARVTLQTDGASRAAELIHGYFRRGDAAPVQPV